MSGRSLFEPLKHLLRSPSGRRYRCNWCREQFEDHAKLSDHLRGTEQITSINKQECLPAYLCDWCGARFESHFGLSEHIRGTTRSATPSSRECLLDSLDASSKILEISEISEPASTGGDASAKRHLRKAARSRTTAPNVMGSSTLWEEMSKADPGSELMGRREDNINSLRESVKDPEDQKVLESKTGRIMLDTTSATSDESTDIVTLPTTSMNTLRPLSFSNKQRYGDPSEGRSDVKTSLVPFQAATSANAAPMRFDTVGSTRSFATARTTSIASYRTAPSFSRRAVPTLATDPIAIFLPAPLAVSTGNYEVKSALESTAHGCVLGRIMHEAEKYGCDVSRSAKSILESMFSNREYMLARSENISLATMAGDAEAMVLDTCRVLFPTSDRPNDWDKLRGAVARHIIDFVASVCDLGHLAPHLDRYFRQTSSCPLMEKPPEVFSSEWLSYLKLRGLILGSREELDWSGRGQHVEYDSRSEKEIPLKVERTLGYSATAIVDSVKCRRIRLARKKIRCTRQLSKMDCIAEVEHLHRLQHAHILRVVGTYTFKKDLAILLYPVAPWNLEEFMDELLDTESVVNADVLKSGTWRDRAGARALRTSFGCLACAIAFIHDKNVKHMDIKPKNILIRSLSRNPNTYKIYIADFGIARSYKSAQDAETDSPVAFTRTYAAPEVVLQDTRGFSADIFSLGCVFLEMLATLVSKPYRNERQKLADIRMSSSKDSSYHANLDPVKTWYQDVFGTGGDEYHLSKELLELTPRMIERLAHERPSADELDTKLANLRCGLCDEGPEPFEAAGELL